LHFAAPAAFYNFYRLRRASCPLLLPNFRPPQIPLRQVPNRSRGFIAGELAWAPPSGPHPRQPRLPFPIFPVGIPRSRTFPFLYRAYTPLRDIMFFPLNGHHRLLSAKGLRNLSFYSSSIMVEPSFSLQVQGAIRSPSHISRLHCLPAFPSPFPEPPNPRAFPFKSTSESSVTPRGHRFPKVRNFCCLLPSLQSSPFKPSVPQCALESP